MEENTQINIAVVCQKYSNFELIENGLEPITLKPIEMTLPTFRYIFYETDSFNINPAAGTNPSLFDYVSLLPGQIINGDPGATGRFKLVGVDPITQNPIYNPFSLLDEIYSNIQECLDIPIEAIEPTSRIILNKEVSSIKSLCNLHCQSIVNSLKWSDVVNIILADSNYHPELPLNLSITLVFVSSTQNVSNLVVLMSFIVNGFSLNQKG